jgi:hypothetical protein
LTGLKYDNSLFQAHEFFFFAALLLADMAVLAFMATRYEYVDFTTGNSSSSNGSSGNNDGGKIASPTEDEHKVD